MPPVGDFHAKALLLGLVSVLLPILAARGVVLRVPQQYATIQGALDAVVDDDTVLVSLGTYAEELSAPPLRFWLIGDVPIDTGDFERPMIDPSSLDSARWRKCLSIPAGCQPSIERMAFRNGAAMYPRPDEWLSGGIVIRGTLPATFRFCRLDSVHHGIGDLGGAEDSVHIVAEDCRFLRAPRIQIRALLGRAEVRRCYFQGFHCPNDFILGRDHSSVEECVFEADSIYGMVTLLGTDLVLRGCAFGPVDSCADNFFNIQSYGDHPALIADNVFHDIATGDLDFSFLVRLNGEPNLFRDNVLYNISTYGSGQGSDICVYVVGAIMENNLFSHFVCPPYGTRGKVVALWAGCTLERNRFVNMEDNGAGSITYHSGSSGSQLRRNQFEADDYAVRARWSSSLDAVGNYWGDASGPYNANYNPNGLGARVDDAVLFDPWCPDTTCNLSVPGIGRPLPKEFVLEAYPNPFNSTLYLTLIPSEVGIVKAELFDILGRRVDEIWHGPMAFQKEISFDASALASGLYFARVTDVISRKSLAMRKVMLLK